MASSLWRLAHLLLALVTFLFLIIASVTGVILAGDAIQKKAKQQYQTENFDTITIAQSLTGLCRLFPEISSITVDKYQQVILEAINEDGDIINAYINPQSGEILGIPESESEFILFITALHRSLFLHETGRFIVGLVSFLLLLIVISGVILIAKRQQGFRYFFSKIKNDFASQYIHVFTGRLLLLPIFILALSGTYLFMNRFGIFPIQESKITLIPSKEEEESKINLTDFYIFKNTLLKDLNKIEFPFSDDEDEYFLLKYNDREIELSQVNGSVVSETRYSNHVPLENLSLDVHTGRTSIVWAIILGLASLNMLVFIYTGFAITLKRFASKVKNKYKPEEAEYIILVGSENGSSTHFAGKLVKQLISNGTKACLLYLNEYRVFPNAKYLVVFTATYGMGESPSNAIHFEKLLKKYPQNQDVYFSVVGFGSRSYKDFCAYAFFVHQLLQKQEWARKLSHVYTVNDKSAEEFTEWVKFWSIRTDNAILTSPSYYKQKNGGLKSFKVVSTTLLDESSQSFIITVVPKNRQKFSSGDLLAIYPANDERERLYSIGKSDQKIQLVVKLHEHGIGSQFLYSLKSGDKFRAKILRNQHFHFPNEAPSVVMIANGTGIAPFLGMISENTQLNNLYLYGGFRHKNNLTRQYQDIMNRYKNEEKLSDNRFAYSREVNNQYVMDLISDDAQIVKSTLANSGVIMICGAMAMQKDVEKILESICSNYLDHDLEHYKQNRQILTDCY